MSRVLAPAKTSSIRGDSTMGALLKFVQENFAHVFPILAAAAFAVVITIDRFYALIWKFPLVGTESFFDKVRNLVMNDRLNEAILLCERYRSKPVASVVREGLIRAHQPENLIEHG